MPEPTAPPTTRRAGVPRLVVAATVAFGLLAAVWSVVAPLGEAPDEPAHLALVLHLADGHPYPTYDGLENQAAIIRLCKTYAAATRACPRPGEVVTPTSVRRHPLGEAPSKASRPAWDDEGGDRSVGQVNQMPQHPPLYYEAMATVLRVERGVRGGPWSADRELALLRLVNALLVAPLPLLAWWAARRFGATGATASAAALAPFLLPMLTHIGSTLNNDNLLTLLGAAIVALGAGVARGDRSARTAIGLGVLVGLGLLTKAFALVFPPFLLLAYVVGAREVARRDDAAEPGAGAAPEGAWGRWRAPVTCLAIVGVLAVAIAGWFYVGRKVQTGRFTPTTEDLHYTTAMQTPGFEPSLPTFARQLAWAVDTRAWGSFGWYTVRVPGWWAALATLAVAVALGAALWRRRDEADSTRGQRLVLLVPSALLGLLVAQHAWSLYTTTSKFQFMQGRYLFAGVAGMSVLVALGTRRALGRWAAVGLAAAAALLQVDALRRCLEVWWGGPGLGPRGQARALVAWSAWPGEALGLLAVLAVAAGAWLVVELVLGLRAAPQAADADLVGSTPP